MANMNEITKRLDLLADRMSLLADRVGALESTHDDEHTGNIPLFTSVDRAPYEGSFIGDEDPYPPLRAPVDPADGFMTRAEKLHRLRDVQRELASLIESLS